MPRANNAANRKLRHNALCCSITFADTRYEFQLEEHHVVSLKDGVINDPAVVNFHVASIGNRYAESCDQRYRPVFVLPGICFAEWRKGKPRNVRLDLANNYNVFKSEHIAFPFYWDSQGRWLLIILAGFGQLLGHENPGTTNSEDLDFTFIVIDTQYSESKPQYTGLARSLREFTASLLRLQLDAHHGAIQSAKIVVPSSTGFDEDTWSLGDRRKVMKWFQAYVAVHASMEGANRAWKESKAAHRPPTGLAPGDSGEEEIDPVEDDSGQ